MFFSFSIIIINLTILECKSDKQLLVDSLDLHNKSNHIGM